MDLRKPGEEEDEYSELAEEAMDPENCFPDGKKDGLQPGCVIKAPSKYLLTVVSYAPPPAPPAPVPSEGDERSALTAPGEQQTPRWLPDSAPSAPER